jgi:putative colanic acid biosysnthesis UDP-glucose lipid carrier transferase
MYKRFFNLYKIILLVGDYTLLNLAFLISYIFNISDSESLFSKDIHLILIFNLIWFPISYILKMYDMNRQLKFTWFVSVQFQALIFHALLVSFFIGALITNSREFLLFFYILFGILFFVFRLSFLFTLRFLRKIGYNQKSMIIIGAGPVGKEMAEELSRHADYGYKFLGFFDDYKDKWVVPEHLVLGNISEGKEFAIKNNVDEIFCALPQHAMEKIRDLMAFADRHLIRFRIVPDFRGFLNKKVRIDFFDYMPVMTIRSEPLESITNRSIKRTFDIAVSLLVVVLIFPLLFLVIGVLIKLSSPGPVFYFQTRSGRDYNPFRIWKFRTMTVTHSDEEFVQVTKNDSKVTPIGAFLRKTNIDEIPQFINVLIGDMSLVGPRPHPLKLNDQYKNNIRKYMIRHLVKPGITGLAQINGYRGETQEQVLMEKRLLHDVWYIENWSFVLDIKILFLTVWNMLKGQDKAY